MGRNSSHRGVAHVWGPSGLRCSECGCDNPDHPNFNYTDATTHCSRIWEPYLNLSSDLNLQGYCERIREGELDFVGGEWVEGVLAVQVARVACGLPPVQEWRTKL